MTSIGGFLRILWGCPERGGPFAACARRDLSKNVDEKGLQFLQNCGIFYAKGAHFGRCRQVKNRRTVRLAMTKPVRSAIRAAGSA